MLLGDERKDAQSGKFVGVKRPWNDIDLSDRWLKRAEDKAHAVTQGIESFDRDEIQKLLAYMVRRGQF